MKQPELPWVLRGQPWAVRGRHALFPGIYDDVIVTTGAVVAIPALVMSVETRAFTKRVARLVAAEHHITFKLRNEVLVGIQVGALSEAIIDVWRSEKKADRAHHALAAKCVHAMIDEVTKKAPGLVEAFFGPDLFKPVKP